MGNALHIIEIYLLYDFSNNLIVFSASKASGDPSSSGDLKLHHTTLDKW